MKIYLPLLNNGNGAVMQGFMVDFVASFSNRKDEFSYVLAAASDSHANRGMNKIANAFLETDCEVWINIDADIRFRRVDIDNLLGHDLPLVYGIYPKKEDAANPCLCTLPELQPPDKNGLVEVRRSGRGFMLVKREVLEAMKEDNGGPALRYHNHGSPEQPRKVEWDFFPSGVVSGEFSALENPAGECWTRNMDADGYPIREWISEDWFFAERARKLGYKTMVDTRIALGHDGQKTYRFGWDQVTRMDSDIKSWKEIQGWFDYETFYHELALEIPDGGSFMEVGCWLGRSIAAFSEFAQAADKKIELHVTDTFNGVPSSNEQASILEAHGGSVEKAFRGNMKSLGLNVNVHVKPSVEVASECQDESFDAVFIDGDHRYEFVIDDIAAWLPKVKRTGILCGHDIDEAGVNAAVKKVFGDEFNTRGRCWLVRKMTCRFNYMHRAEVLADLLLNGEPTKAGTIVELDENTFVNLIRQGLRKPAPVNADEPVFVEAEAKPAKPRRPSGATVLEPVKAKRRRGRPPSKKKAHSNGALSRKK